jgi:Cytidylyltransferase family.
MIMGNLTQRVLTAVIGVPLLCSIFYKGGLLFLILILAIILVGGLEFFKLLEEKKISSERGLGIISSLALGVAAYFGYFLSRRLFLWLLSSLFLSCS